MTPTDKETAYLLRELARTVEYGIPVMASVRDNLAKRASELADRLDPPPPPEPLDLLLTAEEWQTVLRWWRELARDRPGSHVVQQGVPLYDKIDLALNGGKL